MKKKEPILETGDPLAGMGDMAKSLQAVVDQMKPDMEKLKRDAMKGCEKIQPVEQRTVMINGQKVSLILSKTNDIFIEFPETNEIGAQLLYDSLEESLNPPEPKKPIWKFWL